MMTTIRRRRINRVSQTVENIRQAKPEATSVNHQVSKQLRKLGREKIRDLDVAEFIRLSELFKNNGELTFISKALSGFRNVNHFMTYLAGKEKKPDAFLDLKLDKKIELLYRLIELLKDCRLMHSSRAAGLDNCIYLEKTALDHYSRVSQIE